MAAIANFDIYSEHGQLRRPLVWSLGLHLGFAAFVVLYAVFIPSLRGEGWGSGGGGDAMGATLVSAVPLPANPTETQNVLATESKGLSKSQPVVQEKEPEAIPIPDKNTKTKVKPAPVKSATQRKAQPEPEESNQIPYGEGGPVSGPYSMTAGSGQGGFASSGSGDFSGLFPWYVQAMARKIAENRQGVDSRITDAKSVWLTFEVARDGRVSHIELEQTSGVPVVDQAALNTIRRIDSFGPLPPEYSGSKLFAEWHFDPDWSKK